MFFTDCLETACEVPWQSKSYSFHFIFESPYHETCRKSLKVCFLKAQRCREKKNKINTYSRKLSF